MAALCQESKTCSVHHTYHNSAYPSLLCYNEHAVPVLPDWISDAYSFASCSGVDYMASPHLKLLLKLGHQPPHTDPLPRSAPASSVWTLQHLFPPSLFNGCYQAARLFWEENKIHRQSNTVSVTVWIQIKMICCN